MSSDTRRRWTEIEPDATELARLLAPACQEIKIAGSARRGRVDIADVEIVCIPRLFDDRNALHWLLDELLAAGSIGKAKLGQTQATRWGPKYRAVMWRGVHYDLFLTDEDSWGYIYFLRTGPGDANEYLVTRLKSAPFKVENGAVWKDGVRISVKTEEVWFRLLNLPFLKPSERTLNRYMELMPRNHQWGVMPVETSGEAIDPRYHHDCGKVWVRRTENVTVKYKSGEFYVGKLGWHVESRTVFDLCEPTSPAARYWMQYATSKPPVLQDFYYEELTRWLDTWLPVADYVDTSDLPDNYLLPIDPKIESVAISEIQSIEATYSPAVVVEYVAKATLLDQTGRLPLVSKFADMTLLMDGEHRKRAALARGLTHIDCRVQVYEETFAQACGVGRVDDEKLAEVLEECLAIFLSAA